MWRLQQYDYEICYKLRKGTLTANTLSTAYIEDCERSPAEAEVESINASHFLPVPYHSLKEIQKKRDDLFPNVQSLKDTILEGYLVTKDDVLETIHPSHSRRASSTSVKKKLKYYLNS